MSFLSFHELFYVRHSLTTHKNGKVGAIDVRNEAESHRAIAVIISAS
jgi:hypothetical protein